MKIATVIMMLMTIVGCKENNQNLNKNELTQKEENMSAESIYDFTVEDINGKPFEFENLKGKKLMIVNTASKCGLTPQYKELQALYDEYKNQGFTIVAFPANDFMSQEPGTNEEIIAFCEKNYGVTFPVMSKISVKGNNMHPVYQFLTQKAKNGVQDSEVEWNFQKYLINESGTLEKVISPRVSPQEESVVNWVKS